MCVRVVAWWTPRFFLLSLALTLSFPALLKAQVFQWTDARGVIHFTDNPSAIPDSIQGSPQLIIRTDLKLKSDVSEGAPEVKRAIEDSAVEVNPAPAAAPPKAEPEKTPASIIHYNPQQFTIVVINSPIRRLTSPQCGRHIFGCRGTFRPSFDDRRFIHPSAFDGGSRQYIQP